MSVKSRSHETSLTAVSHATDQTSQTVLCATKTCVGI